VQSSDTASEIWILDADGTNLTVAACDGAPCADVAGWPAWSPDGTKLAFSRAIPRGPAEDYDRIAIEVVDLATSATTVVAAPPVASSEYVEYQNPRWSPDGAQLAFTVMRYPVPPTDENIRSSAIAIVEADGSGSDSPRIVTDPEMFGAYPDWSPDGQRIVFNTYPLGSFQETTKATNLYTVRPDGTDLTQVTQFGENDTRATESTWTPDGQHIIFTNIERNPANSWGERLIALTDADGSNLTLIPIPASQQDGHGDAWYGTHARMRPTP
jgi:Tol biopolymer transport system component